MLATALIIGVVVSQLVAAPKASAEDYFIGSSRSYNIYLMTNTAGMSSGGSISSCYVKVVSPRNTVEQIRYDFFCSTTGEGFFFEGSNLTKGMIFRNNDNGFPIVWKIFNVLSQIVGEPKPL